MDLKTALSMEADAMQRLKKNAAQNSESGNGTQQSSSVHDLISFNISPTTTSSPWEFFEQPGTSTLPSRGSTVEYNTQNYSFLHHSSSHPSFLQSTTVMSTEMKRSDSNESFTKFLAECKSHATSNTSTRAASLSEGVMQSRARTLNNNSPNFFTGLQKNYNPYDSPQHNVKGASLGTNNSLLGCGTLHPSNPFSSSSNLANSWSAGTFRSNISDQQNVWLSEVSKTEQSYSKQDEINDIFQTWLDESCVSPKEKPREETKSFSFASDWREWDPLHQPSSPVSPKAPPLPPKSKQEENGSPVFNLAKREEMRESNQPQVSVEKTENSSSQNSEKQKFLNTVLRIRESIPWNDPLSNSGCLISPMMPKWQAGTDSERDVDCIKISITAEGMDNPMVFTCNINASVEHVVSQALCIAFEDINEISVSDYRFKVAGKQEILLSGTMLSWYEIVQDCVRFEEDLHLQLVHQSNVDKSLIRTSGDDQHDVLEKNLQKLIEKTSQTTSENVEVVRNAFLTETKKLQGEFALTSNLTASQQCNRIQQSVKAVCQHLGNIETIDVTHSMLQLRNSVNRLSDVREDTFSTSTLENQTNNNTTKEENTSQAVQALISSVCSFIDMFSVGIELETSYTLQSPMLSSNVYDSVTVNIVSAHRLPQMWNSMYEEYYLSCELFYGDKPLSCAVNTQVIKSSKSYHARITWNEWLTFPMKVCDLPRESKLCLTLHGIPKTESAKSEKVNSKELSWINVHLFNHKSILLQGGSLHRMLSAANTSRYDRVSSSCPSKIINNDSLVIHLQILSSQERKSIVFPPFSVPTTRKRFTGNPLSSLDESTQQDLAYIWSKNQFVDLMDKEKDLLWRHRYVEEAMKHPGHLARVLRCAPSWSPQDLGTIYQLLESWPSIQPIEAFELLSASFPDQHVRSFAVQCIQQGEEDEIHDYLIQLVQALKFEIFYDNSLFQFLFRSALGNIRICHKLYWLLKENTFEGFYVDKYQLMLHALDATIGAKIKKEFEKEAYLVKLIQRAAEAVKYAKDSARSVVLEAELVKVISTIKNHCFRLPTNPAQVANGIDSEKSSYFTSNAMPLKLLFHNSEASPKHFHLMYKVGDDLRQDVLTMQLVRIMDKLWLAEGLDLKMITFNCLSTGVKRGFIELVPDSITLREIQSSYGLTGAFKDRPIAEWLQKYNPTRLSYGKAEENFTLSCAGYCVATYVLGICDRHNDNIMLRQSGHLFHIDFARFLGHAQMFGNIKRDRAPFVLTADMAYVINGGDRPSSRFHDFVDICCQAFNIIRKNTHLFINLLSLMTQSGIDELKTTADLKYVYDALKPAATESEATTMFTRLIEASLSSSFTRINFFIHALAQIRFHGNENEDKKSLSFVSKVHTAEEDGLITSATVVGYQKKYIPDKHYLFCVRLIRELRSGENYVFRTFNEFAELHQKLCAIYPSWKLPSFPNRVIVGRSQVKQVAERRKIQLNAYLHMLLNSHIDVAKNDLIYTFFHPLLRDEQANAGSGTKEQRAVARNGNNVGGEIKVSVHYKNKALFVMIMHCRNLISPDGNDPDPYVKTYLLPDSTRNTKRKTKVARKTFNPTYNEMIVYDVPFSSVKTRSLHISVWNYEPLNENDFMGGVNLQLGMMDLTEDNTSWYPLTSGHFQ